MAYFGCLEQAVNGEIYQKNFPSGNATGIPFPKVRRTPLEDPFGVGVVYYYYRKWQRNGVLRNLTWKLNALFRQQKSKEPTPSVLSIDSQSVKKAPFVREQTGIDGNKKVNGRKRHILTDTLGLIWSEGLLPKGMPFLGNPLDWHWREP